MSVTKVKRGGRVLYRVQVPGPDGPIGVTKVLDAERLRELGANGGMFPRKADARAAEAEARRIARAKREAGVSVGEWWDEWTSHPRWERPKDSTNIHYAERTKGFKDAHAETPLSEITENEVRKWVAGHPSTLASLKVMFEDARLAGHRKDNPARITGDYVGRRRKRRAINPPREVEIASMLEHARRLTPPSFAAWLQTACWSAARPGELDYLKWEYVDFARERIWIEDQWNAKARKPTKPKNGKGREIAMTEPVIECLRTLPRESEFAFTTLRGRHYTPSSRAWHWKAVRIAADMPETSMYMATRHFFAAHMLNVVGLEPHKIAHQLGHEDGGALVLSTYGHPDKQVALDAVTAGVRETARVETIAHKIARKQADGTA